MIGISVQSHETPLKKSLVFSSISMKTTAIRQYLGPYDKFDFERSHVFEVAVSKVMLADDKVVVWECVEERSLI